MKSQSMKSFWDLPGYTYNRGIDEFENIMSSKRVYRLYQGWIETHRGKFDKQKFYNWIVCIAGRKEREIRKNAPVCKKDCSWRQPYTRLDNQVNALRIEIMSPADRCFYNLKDGRIGGHPDDYYPCTFKHSAIRKHVES